MIQLQLPIGVDGTDAILHQEMSDLRISMDKVRKKVFCEISEMKKIMFAIQQQNMQIKDELRELQDKKMQWEYAQGDALFTLVEKQA